MDIIQTIMGMLSGNVMSKLSSLIGVSEANTQSAVSTAVPALLAGMSQVASTPNGAQRLVSAMDQFGASSTSPITGLLGGQAGNIAEQGNTLLKSLFGGGASSGLAGMISRFAGIGSGSATRLLPFLAPLVMGGLAKHFVGQSVNASSLSNFFASQKSNIANALPQGFSLAEIPGLGTAASAVASTAESAYRGTNKVAQAAGHQAAATGRWLAPALVGLAILAGLIYFISRAGTPRHEIPHARLPGVVAPDLTQVRSNIAGTFTSINDSLAEIKDSATATAALPTLRALDSRLDTVKSWTDQLPQSARTSISEYTTANLGGIVDHMNTALANPGVSDTLRPTLQSIVSKLSGIAGVPATHYTLTSPVIQPVPTVRD
ncbi:MAG: DUF937 domain-containing protein [Phycisphaerales bacterium]|nr:DUF937 domain-containing protein [Phycisphaerales bacterium]